MRRRQHLNRVAYAASKRTTVGYSRRSASVNLLQTAQSNLYSHRQATGPGARRANSSQLLADMLAFMQVPRHGSLHCMPGAIEPGLQRSQPAYYPCASALGYWGYSGSCRRSSARRST